MFFPLFLERKRESALARDLPFEAEEMVGKAPISNPLSFWPLATDHSSRVGSIFWMSTSLNSSISGTAQDCLKCTKHAAVFMSDTPRNHSIEATMNFQLNILEALVS